MYNKEHYQGTADLLKKVENAIRASAYEEAIAFIRDMVEVTDDGEEISMPADMKLQVGLAGLQHMADRLRSEAKVWTK